MTIFLAVKDGWSGHAKEISFFKRNLAIKGGWPPNGMPNIKDSNGIKHQF